MRDPKAMVDEIGAEKGSRSSFVAACDLDAGSEACASSPWEPANGRASLTLSPALSVGDHQISRFVRARKETRGAYGRGGGAVESRAAAAGASLEKNATSARLSGEPTGRSAAKTPRSARTQMSVQSRNWMSSTSLTL
jgi:hypothetical protein